MSDFAKHYRDGHRFVAKTRTEHVFGPTAAGVRKAAPGAPVFAIAADGRELACNPAEKPPAGFAGWRVDYTSPGVDSVTGKRATVYFVHSPSGAVGVLAPHAGKYRFHEQLDLFGGTSFAPAALPVAPPREAPRQGLMFNPGHPFAIRMVDIYPDARDTVKGYSTLAEATRDAALYRKPPLEWRRLEIFRGNDVIDAWDNAGGTYGTPVKAKLTNPRRPAPGQRGLALYAGAEGLPIGKLQADDKAIQAALDAWSTMQARAPVRAFRPDDQLIMHSPFTGDDILVNFRGPMPDDKAMIVMPNGHQMPVPMAWLRFTDAQLRAFADKTQNPTILTGQVHQDKTGRNVVTTYEQRGKKRTRVEVPVPSIADWRRDLAAPPRRLSRVPSACAPSPLIKSCQADAPVGVAYTASGKPVEYAWHVMDLSQLTISHDPWTLAPNAAFPVELQPRDRSRASYADQIHRLVQTFQPSLLTWSATASDGAPIVGPDGVVESGNGRTMALSRIYRGAGQKADDYRATVKEWAKFLHVKMPRGIENPVLVRVRQTDLDRGEFARDANVAGQQQMAAAETALSDAVAMPLAMLRQYDASAGLATRANAGFVESFIAHVSGPTSRGDILTSGGTLSKSGEQRIELAMFAKAWGVESEPLLVAWSEDPESDLKVMIGAMADTAPKWLEFAAAVADGVYDRKYLIGGSVVEAAIVFRAAKAAKLHPLDYLRQIDMIQQPSQLAEAWIQAAYPHGKRASRQGLVDAMVAYLELVELQGPLSQSSMFGPVSDPPLVLVKRAANLASKNPRRTA